MKETVQVKKIRVYYTDEPSMFTEDLTRIGPDTWASDIAEERYSDEDVCSMLDELEASDGVTQITFYL